MKIKTPYGKQEYLATLSEKILDLGEKLENLKKPTTPQLFVGTLANSIEDATTQVQNAIITTQSELEKAQVERSKSLEDWENMVVREQYESTIEQQIIKSFNVQAIPVLKDNTTSKEILDAINEDDTTFPIMGTMVEGRRTHIAASVEFSFDWWNQTGSGSWRRHSSKRTTPLVSIEVSGSATERPYRFKGTFILPIIGDSKTNVLKCNIKNIVERYLECYNAAINKIERAKEKHNQAKNLEARSKQLAQDEYEYQFYKKWHQRPYSRYRDGYETEHHQLKLKSNTPGRSVLAEVFEANEGKLHLTITLKLSDLTDRQAMKVLASLAEGGN